MRGRRSTNKTFFSRDSLETHCQRVGDRSKLPCLVTEKPSHGRDNTTGPSGDGLVSSASAASLLVSSLYQAYPILGRLLFIVYINGLQKLSNSDFCIYNQYKDPQQTKRSGTR